MRKVTIHLIVALCTFILGSIVALFGAASHSSSPQRLDEIPRLPPPQCGDKTALDSDADLSASANLPLLDYCELADNASCYSGKIIRVKAKLSGDDHGILLLYGEACSSRASMAAGRLTGVTSKQYSQLLTKACGRQCDKPLDVIIVGRFDKVMPSGRTDLNWDMIPMRLELLRIEGMSKER